MLATINASSLNVRSLPSNSGRVLGVLPSGTVVDVLSDPKDIADSWAEIRYQDQTAFVYGAYLQPTHHSQRLSGIVDTPLLNVREAASVASDILGTVRQGVVVNIRGQAGSWFEIEFNGGLGYVSQTYIEPFYADQAGFTAHVLATSLNVRAAADPRASVLGQLSQGSRVQIESMHGKWGQITFNGAQAFVHADFVQRMTTQDDDERLPVAEDDEPEAEIPQAEPVESSLGVSLVPTRLLEVAGNAQTRKVAATWNRFGGLLEELCEQKQIDPAAAVAVLCVESSGKGFEQNNQNRMIIRFENHKFWRYWGKHHPQEFKQHFRYKQGKVWTGHAWNSGGDNWMSFHGNQAKEWRVLEFAEQLDKDAARLSISMGAPQIMGFHYQRIGYESVSAMFDAFAEDIGPQIRGLFDFFSNGMIADLRSLDFTGFASAYKGSGQKEKYGRWINEHYQAFKTIYR